MFSFIPKFGSQRFIQDSSRFSVLRKAKSRFKKIKLHLTMRFFSNPNNWTSGLKEMLLPYNMNTVSLVQHKFKILSFYTNCNTSSLL